MTVKQINRRQFHRILGLSALAGTLPACSTALLSRGSAEEQSDWLSADAIKASTRVPEFPVRDFVVEDFAAVADGKTDCTAAITAAIAACHEAGGGRVVLSKGVYRTGAVHLKSHVNLHIKKGAELSFFTDPQHYLPAVFTRWEGMEMMGYSPLIYAYEQDNVAVTGEGVLNGNAGPDMWWPWKGAHKERNWNLLKGQDQKPARDKLFAMAEAGIAPDKRDFSEGSYLRPSFVQFYRCKQVMVEGVTVKDAPFWLVHPVLSEDVTVRAVTCFSHGPNSDGCNPESCNRVVIERCTFDTGDDCIAVKSGRNNDGRRLATPSENILIQDCVMRAGHGGIVMGSEISGGVRNLHARRCVMSSPELERAIRIKTNAARGGTIEHIRYSDIKVGEVQDAVVVNFYYEEGENGEFMPTVRDVEIRDFYVRNAQRAFVLRGFPNNPVSGLAMRNCNIVRAEALGVVDNVSDVQLQQVRVNGTLVQASEFGA